MACRVTPWVASRSWLGLKIIARRKWIEAFCQVSSLLAWVRLLSLVQSMVVGAAAGATRGTSPSSLGAGKRGRRACPLCCTCFWCPAQSSFRNEWDFYITSLQKLHLSTLGETFLEEYLVGLGWGNSDPWEAARWFRHNNRELSAFGTFQVKNNNKKTQPQHRPKMKTFSGFHGRQGITSQLLQALWAVEIILQLLL